MRIRVSSILSLIVLFLAGLTGVAQSSKINTCVPSANAPTANLGLTKPGHCVANWDALYNTDLDQLDTWINSHTAQITTLQQQAGSTATGVYMVSAFPGADFGAQLNACVLSLNPVFGGTCDARGLGGLNSSMASSITISTPNTVINLPCGTITTAQQVIVAPGTRNVSIKGCSYRGGANVGSNGGTIWAYTGTGKAFQVGDPSYAQDTKGFHMDNVDLVTANAGTAATAFAFYRTQEIDLRSVYLNGNQLVGQTGILLDGTGNYSGGTFDSDTLNGFGTAVYMTGHQSGSVSGDFSNASTFTRLHVVCPTSSGSPISGTYGVNVVAGDGNTWTGGDIESCDTMFHLGANAINNTIVGLRNENSNVQYVADSGSSYNAVFTGGTLFTGKLVDNGTRNSFWDTFHHTANGIKGDYYASQQDATLVNHLRLGIGTGIVRGIQWESQVDLGTSSSVYNWLWGLTDGASGQSNWIYQDLINNVIRLQFQQNNTAGGSNPTAVNAAGTGNVCFNCSSNSGTGGVAFSSGGPTPTTVGTVDGAGNAHFIGNHQTDGTSQSAGTNTVRNNADAEVDYILQAGATATQKASYTYRDYSGVSQWYMVKTQTNDWALNSALGLIDSFKAYQPANGGDTYINAQLGTGVVRINYEPNSGTSFKIYGGNSSTVYAAFTGLTSIQFPGLASSSGYNCLQVDTTGYLSKTGSGCNPAATTSTPGGVILPSGAANNQLGSAAMQPTTAFDAAGAAAAAQSASVAKTNTLGCLDGYDHLPCEVYNQPLVSESAGTGTYATVWTTTAAGVYRINGYTYSTVCGTSSTTSNMTVTQFVKAVETGITSASGATVSSWQVGSNTTSCSSGVNYSVIYNLASGVAVQTQTALSISNSGTQSSAATWSRAVQIERLQ